MSDSSRAASSDWRWWHLLAADLRSLALFRIAIGSLLVVDLVARLPDIDAFFTDNGVLPRDALIGRFIDPWAISLHLMSGQYSVQLALFLIAIVFALGLAVGYRTRLCAAVSWLLVSSMQVRNPVIMHGGDVLFRVLLFWCMFAPLNARFSLDRALNPTAPPADPTHLSAGSLALMLQICFVYWFTAILKWHPVWNTEGSALYYALSLDQFVTPAGRFLLRFPRLLRLMTFGTLTLEFVGPILVFCPALGGLVRLLIVLLFIGFHAGIGLAMHLGLFPWVCASAWLAFLPGIVWEALARRTATGTDQGTTIFFDGRCSFCRRAVLILRGFLGLNHTAVREAQSEPDVGALMLKRNAWVVRDPAGNLHTGYDAFVELCRRSSVGRPLARAIGSAPARRVGERAYRWIASHRVQSMRLLRALTPPPPRRRPGIVSSGIAIVCLALVLAWNVSTIGGPAVPVVWRRVASLTQLRQQWGMFAPYPNREDGWFVIEGVKLDGTRFDLWRGGGAPTDAKPDDVAATYRNAQWRRYLISLWLASYSEYRVYFGRYLCHTWNTRHEGAQRLNLIYISYLLEFTPPPGQPVPQPTKELVWRHYCFEKPPDW